MSITIKLKRAFLIGFVAAFGTLLFVFNTAARDGVIKGLTICFNTVIPSLFLLTALSCFLAQSGVLQSVGRLFSPVTSKIFGLNGEETAIFLLSLVSGYPTGAKMLESLYNSRKICRKRANIMLIFCINAGPGFVISAVGGAILGSESDGKRLFLAMVLSAFIMAIFCSFFLRKTENKATTPATNNQNLADVFVHSVSDSATSMFNVSAFVVAFSGIIEIFKTIGTDGKLKTVVLSLLEVTVGVGNCTRNNLQTVAFLVGFGGVSVILQVKSQAGKLNPKILSIFASRLIAGGLMAGFICVFELISPRAVQTSGLNFGQTTATLSANPVAVGALVLLALTLVISVGQQSNKHLKTAKNSDIL